MKLPSKDRSPSSFWRQPRRRWYGVLLGTLCAYYLLTQVYDSLLPVSGWLNREIEAIQDARYADAERAFQHARRLAPRAEIVDVAFHVLYWHLSHDKPMAVTRYYYLGSLAQLVGWTPAKERAWRARNEIRAADWLQQAAWPARSYRTLGVAATLFDQYWPAHPREVLSIVTAMLAIRDAHYQQAYDLCAQLERQRPEIFQQFYAASPFLFLDYAVAAQHCGYPEEARHLRRSFRTQPPFWYNTYADFQDHSIIRCDPAHEDM